MSYPTITEDFGWPVKLNVQRTQLMDEQFLVLCQENPELRLELSAGESVLPGFVLQIRELWAPPASE